MGAIFVPKKASQIKNTPAGNISATNVQDALNELDTEKQPALGYTPENVANKGIANGYCGLDTNALIPLANIPQILTGKDADTVDGYHHNQSLLTTASPSFAGLTLSGLTAGRVLFAGSGGAISQNVDLFWDNINRMLGIGTTAPAGTLHVANASSSAALVVASSGNVGIGTLTPIDKFNIDYGYDPTGNTYLGDWIVENAFIRTPFFSAGVAENLLLWTEDFDNSVWVKTGIGTVTANTVGNPNGYVNAENIPAGSDANANIAQTITNSETGWFTAGVWARAQSGTATIKLRIDSSAQTGTEKSYTIGTRWQFLTVSQNFTTANTSKTFRIITGTNAVSLWGAQLNRGNKPKAYMYRTSSPVGNYFGVFPTTGMVWRGSADWAGGASYSTYGSYNGYSLSNASNKTNQWEYVGYIYLAYDSTYHYGQSWNVELNLVEKTNNNTNRPYDKLENVKLFFRGFMPSVSDSSAFNTTVPSFIIELSGRTNLISQDVAALIYSTGTSSKQINLYVKLKTANSHYELNPIYGRFVASYNSSGSISNSFGYFYVANNASPISTLPTPAQGGIVYGTPTFIMSVENNNIGIGTTAPNYRCHVNGTFGFAPGSSVTPANNGDVVIEATSNTILTFKLKGSDGVVRTGTIILV